MLNTSQTKKKGGMGGSEGARVGGREALTWILSDTGRLPSSVSKNSVISL